MPKTIIVQYWLSNKVGYVLLVKNFTKFYKNTNYYMSSWKDHKNAKYQWLTHHSFQTLHTSIIVSIKGYTNMENFFHA